MGRRKILTFQGMARLARHVINEFIRRQPKVEAETYDSRNQRAGIITVPLAARYWVGRADNLTAKSGSRRLEGFIEEIATGFGRETERVQVTDLRDMLAKVEELLPKMHVDQRRPFLTLYVLYNRLVIPTSNMKNFERVENRYGSELDSPSVEGMLTHLLSGTVPSWPLCEHRAVHDAYLKNQYKRLSLKIPPPLRAGLSLALAERYRVFGKNECARALISTAVENNPSDTSLLQLEETYDPEKTINWPQ